MMAGSTPMLPDFPKELDKGKAIQAQYIRRHFSEELQKAPELKAKGYKYAYLFVMGNPIELLRPFDVFIGVYPEITSLNISYKGEAIPVLDAAEGLVGFPTDVCGYVKMGVASTYMANKIKVTVPVIGHMPEPDLMVLHYTGCQVYIHWWELYQYMFNTPVLVYDIPHLRHLEDTAKPHKEDIEYVAEQLKDSVPFLEKISGVPFDENKFKETVKITAETWDYWRQTIEMEKLVPAPYDAYFEAIYYMSMITIYRGTKDALDYYKYLLDELKARYKFINEHPEYSERFRLIFEGVPPYHNYKSFWNLFKRWGARMVYATYPKVPGMELFRFDPSRPWESEAEYMILPYCNINYKDRAEILAKYVDEYKADGVVIHSIKSCKSFSSNHGDFKEYLSKELDVPVLLIESDHVDPRYYSEAQIKNRIDAYFEALSLRAKR
jgi:benzoyl-CoA reductase subunit B